MLVTMVAPLVATSGVLSDCSAGTYKLNSGTWCWVSLNSSFYVALMVVTSAVWRRLTQVQASNCSRWCTRGYRIAPDVVATAEAVLEVARCGHHWKWSLTFVTDGTEQIYLALIVGAGTTDIRLRKGFLRVAEYKGLV